MTHPSFAQELVKSVHRNQQHEAISPSRRQWRLLSHERLIPLGESILDFAITHILYQQNPQASGATRKVMAGRLKDDIVMGSIAQNLDDLTALIKVSLEDSR
jgi:dsRNA-specific ribonuclease